MQNNFLRILAVFFTLALCFKYPQNAFCAANVKILYGKAADTAKSGNIDQAINEFNTIIEISPYYSLAHYGLGKAYIYKPGKLKEAISHLQLSITYDPFMAKGYFYLGMAYMLSRKYEQALNAFFTAYDKEPALIEALYNIGAIYETLNINFKSELYFQNYLYQKNKDADSIF